MRTVSCALLLPLLLALAVRADEPVRVSAELVTGNNAFAFDLHQQLAQKSKGNLFYSPISISTALAMTYAGAGGETAKQMAQALHFSLPPDQLHAQFGKLLAQLNDNQGGKRPYQMAVANRLWGQQGLALKQPFRDITSKHYGAGLELLDFVSQPEQSRQTINSWVEDQTNKKIVDLLPPGSITPDTRLVLTNAIYFKGNWVRQFNPQMTQEADFKVSAEKKVKAKLMYQKDQFKYYEDPSVQVLEMPYKGGDVAFMVVLPKRIDGLAEVEAKLDATKLAEYVKGLRDQRVIVNLPKFTMTASYQLNEPMSNLGMKDAFTLAANFSGIADAKLKISQIVHKAFVAVDETGTEAAAATGIKVEATSVQVLPTFRADHPFLFFIRDVRSGNILFVGRVVEPTTN
jgi:serpin B